MVLESGFARSDRDVKIKWTNFQISTRSRSMETSIETRDRLHEVALGLIRSASPLPKGIPAAGVTISNFRSQNAGEGAKLPFREGRHRCTEGGWARQRAPPARFAPGVIGQIMDGEGSARVPDNVIDEL